MLILLCFYSFPLFLLFSEWDWWTWTWISKRQISRKKNNEHGYGATDDDDKKKDEHGHGSADDDDEKNDEHGHGSADDEEELEYDSIAEELE